VISLRSLTAVAAATLALGCADLRDLLSLQQGLVREFHEPGIGINLNNASLTVTFSNSAAADLSEAERVAFARRVAEYVRDHYAHFDTLDGIAVGFATVTKTGPMTFRKTTVPYRFAPRDLAPPKVSSKKSLT
jgi:hypothetical protein